MLLVLSSYSCQVSYKREGDDFQLRFSHKFESGEEVFFAFAIPYSYRDTQVSPMTQGVYLHASRWDRTQSKVCAVCTCQHP
jgi:hypothetical protein